MKLLPLLALVIVTGCQKPTEVTPTPTPIKTGDTICIGSNFYVVGDTKAYPWIKLDPNLKCSEHADMPKTYLNVDRLDAFQPDCVCRYTAACRKSCADTFGSKRDACLEACTD